MTDSQRLAVIERIVTDMRDRLFGDDVDEGEIGHLKTRISTLEKWRWKILGAMGALTAAFAFGRFVAEMLAKR